MKPNRSEVLTVEDIAPMLDETPQTSKFYIVEVRNAQGKVIDYPLATPDRRGILIHVEKDAPMGRVGEGTSVSKVEEL